MQLSVGNDGDRRRCRRQCERRQQIGMKLSRALAPGVAIESVFQVPAKAPDVASHAREWRLEAQGERWLLWLDDSGDSARLCGALLACSWLRRLDFVV